MSRVDVIRTRPPKPDAVRLITKDLIRNLVQVFLFCSKKCHNTVRLMPMFQNQYFKSFRMML